MSAFSAYRIFARVLLIVSWLCAALLQFRQDASLARSGSFPIRQLTVRRWAAGDYGHNIGNALFSCSAAIWYCSIACNSFRLCFPFATGHSSGTGLVTVPTCPFVTFTFQFMQRSTDKHLISKPFVCEAWLFNALFNRSIANTLF